MHLIILEGPRTVGKTTLATLLRQQAINYCTQINFTGFADDGPEGLAKIGKYYDEWLAMFEGLKGTDYKFICDRIFFSEMVYSRLCKEYDFTPYYEAFVEKLGTSCDKVSVFHLTITDEAEITERAKRENKVKFKDIGDSVEEVLTQKRGYDEVFVRFKQIKPHNVDLHEIDTSHMSIEQVKSKIIELLG